MYYVTTSINSTYVATLHNQNHTTKTSTMTTRCTTLLLLLVVALTFTNSDTASVINNTHPITAIYVFGDSTVDPGNNDYIPMALFRANHAPYGENFPNHVPTGRFSDGRLATDYLANSLGLKEFIPAYADPSITDQDLSTGVSFASAGSGLDELTIGFSRAIDLTTQIGNFQQAINRMERNLGRNMTRWSIQKSMILLSVGSNDMLFNYFDLPTRAMIFPPSTYLDFLISRLHTTIQSIYKLGARRFVVAGLPPLGCLPIQVSVGSIFPSRHWLERVCVDQQNLEAQSYNGKLQYFLDELKSIYPDGRFIYGDIYSPLMDMINRRQIYGFERTLEGCCGTGFMESGSLCNIEVPICANQSTYVFWDSIHPTQAAHNVLAKALETIVLPKLLS